MRRLVFTPHAWDEYLYWQATDKAVLKRINALLRDVQRTPFTGLGKPEPLKFDLAGKWFRRISSEHRLVYQLDGEAVVVFSCRFHY